MVLHTIIDINEVLNTGKPRDFEYKKIGNCTLQGHNNEKGFVIERIISTNPHDYLNPNYQLGNIIK